MRLGGLGALGAERVSWKIFVEKRWRRELEMEMITQSSFLEYLESKEMGESAFCEKYKNIKSTHPRHGLRWIYSHHQNILSSFHRLSTPPNSKYPAQPFPFPKCIYFVVSGGFNAQIWTVPPRWANYRYMITKVCLPLLFINTFFYRGAERGCESGTRSYECNYMYTHVLIFIFIFIIK